MLLSGQIAASFLWPLRLLITAFPDALGNLAVFLLYDQGRTAVLYKGAAQTRAGSLTSGESAVPSAVLMVRFA